MLLSTLAADALFHRGRRPFVLIGVAESERDLSETLENHDRIPEGAKKTEDQNPGKVCQAVENRFETALSWANRLLAFQTLHLLLEDSVVPSHSG